VDWYEGWLQQKERENIFLMKYEDMLADLPREIERLCHFLNVTITPKTLESIVEDASFSSMQGNPHTNVSYKHFNQQDSKFIRKGKANQWQDYFTVAQHERFEEKYRARLQALGLEY